MQGDFNALAEGLRKHGVHEADVAALENAVREDEGAPELDERKYGPSVKGWLQNMRAKAVDAAWQIDLGVASSLLATALQKYYGWP